MSKVARSPKMVPTVFIIEDDEAVRNGLAFLFSSAGLSVQAFASAEDFLDAQPVSDTGCLVLDIHLPGMNGLELIGRMPEGVADLPVICVTGERAQDLKARAYKAGIFAFVPKPLADCQLLNLVREAIAPGTDGHSLELQSA